MQRILTVNGSKEKKNGPLPYDWMTGKIAKYCCRYWRLGDKSTMHKRQHSPDDKEIHKFQIILNIFHTAILHQ